MHALRQPANEEGSPERPELRTAARLALPALIIAASLLAPFWNKPFSIDDTFFMLQAEHVLEAPLDPTGFEIAWFHRLERVSEFSPNGPVAAYLLAPAAVLGGAEWAAHLVMWLCLGVAAVAMAGLALRLGSGPSEARNAAILLVSTPSVLGMAGTCTPDIPAMMFGILGMERLLAFRGQRDPRSGTAAAIFLAAAALTRPHYVALVAFAALFLLSEMAPPGRRGPSPSSRGALRSFWPLAAATALFAAVSWALRDAQNPTLGLTPIAELQPPPGAFASNLVAFFAHYALAIPFALPWAIARRREFPWWLGATVGGAVLLYLASIGQMGWVAAALAVGLGSTALFDAFRTAWRARDRRIALLASWLLLALPVTFYIHLPSKYLLISVPASALLILWVVRPLPPAGRNAVIAGTTAIGLLFGVLILRADARLADLERKATEQLIAPRVERGAPVWFSGHWGFQWYAMKLGARPLVATPPFPRPGDWIVASRTRSGALLARFEREHVGSLGDATPGGRIMSRQAGAGFFANPYGFLPWGWADDEIGRFDVWRVLGPAPAAKGRSARSLR